MLRLVLLPMIVVSSLAHAADFDVPFLGDWKSGDAALAGEESEAHAARMAQGFVAAHVHPAAQFRTTDLEKTPQGDVLHQVQIQDGVPIEHTSGVAQLRRGHIRFAHYRGVAPDAGTARPQRSADQARDAVATAFMPASMGEPRLLWRRVEDGLQLVWRVPMRLASPPGDWAVDIDAKDGRVVGRSSLDVHAVSGEVVASVERRCQGDAAQPTAMPYIKWNAASYADAQGGFVSSEKLSQAQVELTSPYIEIKDLHAALSGPWMLPLVASPAHNTLALEHGAAAHLDVYYALHQARDWLGARGQLTRRQRGWADRKVTVNVNLDGHCNAFYSTFQESLNFFPAGHGCMDSARSTQALYHEYGHALFFHSTPGDLDVTQALGEGYGDVVAAFVSGNGVIGDIKPNCDTPLRSCINTLSFCKKGCDFHGWRRAYKSAQVVCGAWWDLRSRLMQRYGDEAGATQAADLFVRHLPLVVGDMPDTYAALIAADDDDDDEPRNGTAHSCEINAAYVGHPARFPDLASTVVPCNGALRR